MLDAALRAGIALPYSCQSGNCGTCKCEYVGGEIFELEHSEHALAPGERVRNVILACRTQVWGDITLRRIAAEELVLHPSRVMRCRVERIEQLTHDIREVGLAIGSGGPFTFSAGQYAQLEFAPGLSRHYSMANTPGDPRLSFHIRRLPGGRTSGFVAEHLRVDDEVKVSGPLGVSYLRDGHHGPMLLVAGGSGLAPIESILRTRLSRNGDARVRLYFGARAERDIYHQGLLEELASGHAGFSYQLVLSEGAGSRLRQGLVHESVAEDFADFTGYKVYLAGPPPMVEAASEMLLARGLAQRDIHADAFYAQS